MVISANVCQYWSEGSDGKGTEPGQCPNWDVAKTVCIFQGKDLGEGKKERAEFYPFCNLIGTQIKCNQYAGTVTAVQKRCVRPDPNRRLETDRYTGKEWVIVPSVDAQGAPTGAADFKNITEYHDGKCDGFGTSGHCTGYAPYHLGFSAIQPDDKDGSLEYDKESFTTTTSTGTIVFRLPLKYIIFNERPALSKCHWWDGELEDFTVNSGTGAIESIEFKCVHPDGGLKTGYTTRFNKHVYEDTPDRPFKTWRAPCNGAKPECRFYTGICWKWNIDEKMRQGDKVLAEQILELRYYLRKERWSTPKFKESFKEPIIYAWQGAYTLQYDNGGGITNWDIKAIKNEITDFDNFVITKKKLGLTQGNPDQTGLPNYPHLVRELKTLPLKPIVRNKFDRDEDGIFVFESAGLEDDSLLIFGDTPWPTTTYAINLADPDLAFLKNEFRRLSVKQTGGGTPEDKVRALNDGTAEFEAEWEYYDSMQEVEAAYKIPEEFDVFYDKFDKAINNLLKYWPDKINETEIGVNDFMFYIDTPTVWGENLVLVLSKGGGEWEFDLFRFRKYFVGGLVAQTSFTLEGDSGKTIDYLPAYERDFFAYLNNNGNITFDFASFNNAKGKSAEAVYVYNDAVIKLLATNPLASPTFDTFNMGYQLFKIELEISDNNITEEHMRFFGNTGYVMVDIPDPDKKLSNAFRPWEIKGKLIMFVTDSDGNDDLVEMIIHEQGTNRLEINQMILKPKNIEEYKTPCTPILTFDAIYYYEKRSFGEEPEISNFEIINEDFIGVDDKINYITNMELIDAGDGSYELVKFGRDTMFISIVFRGSITGRIKGLTRTKMITWVRQPYCRDVEIKYTWEAAYQHNTLLPENVCYGRTGVRGDTKLHNRGYQPRCGDHDLSFFSGLGPMWYPYNDCDESAVYPTDPLTFRATTISTRQMEVFNEKDDDGNTIHGAHDLRMLGPQEHFGEICDNHASIWNCTCDWSYCNLDKVSENRFTGFGRYRGNLDDVAKVIATIGGGLLPKFGNPVRDFMRSYRSLDNVDYYAPIGTQFVRRQKWMPAYYFFTSADVTKGVGEYPHKLYTEDLSSPFVHPFGLLLAKGTIEGIEIKEEIETETLGDKEVPKRYKFEEIFEMHGGEGSGGSLTYPYPTNPFYNGNKLIISWYTFRDYTPDTNKSIQWVWQEIWKSVERSVPETDTILGEDSGYDISNVGASSSSAQTEDAEGEIDEIILSRPFLYTDQVAKGPFLFANVNYPDYKYDAEIAEHRLVLDEDQYTLFVTAPVRNNDGEYEEKKFYLQLGTGARRPFDIASSWISDADEDTNPGLYDDTIGGDWVEDVTLFAPGFTSKSKTVAENEGRVIVTYDGSGDKVKTYYQRGLNVSLNTDKFQYLPREKTLITAADVEFSAAPSFVPDENNPAGGIESGESTPINPCIEVGYNSSDGTVDLIFDLTSKKAIDRVVFICKFGAEGLEKDGDGNAISWRLYHIPSLTISHSDIGVIYTTAHSSGGMQVATKEDKLANKEVILDWNMSASDVLDTHSKWRLRFRLQPTSQEINVKEGLSEYINDGENVVFFKCIYVYDTKFANAQENIETFERRYNISVGSHGTFPPHGFEGPGDVLLPSVGEGSTLYQRDTLEGGVTGIGFPDEVTTMNKIRGRLMKETHGDKELLPSQTLNDMEAEQERIYNDIAIKTGATSFILTSVSPPGMDDKLAEVGATFPESWTCDFTNTLILPLTPVKEEPLYNACGEFFLQDFTNFHWEPKCAGGQFGVFSIGPKEVFEYRLFSACNEVVLGTSQDAIVVYYNGIGQVLTNPMFYVGATIGNVEAAGLRANTTSFNNPPAVDTF